MKLIDEAIDLLGDASEPLAKAFFKAQVIAHKLQDKEFSQWVRSEIQGYSANEDVPDYRILDMVPYGNVENLTRRYNSMRLPLTGMAEDIQKKVLVAPFYQSIAVIEDFAKSDKEITLNIDQRLYPLLRDGFDSSYAIVNAWGVLPAGCFTQILNEARSRLLDLLLNLSDLVPETAKEDEQKTIPKIEGLNDMFKGAVFGHGANISLAIGEGNQASHNQTSVVMNDMDSLVRELTENKVSDTDVVELQKAIKDDAIHIESGAKSFGPRVGGWLGTMMVKAGTPAWDIPANVGAGLLTSALSKFFGF